MALHLGDTAPDFEIDSTQGRIKFHDWIGDSWCFFFSHPADFTPVCTTEMGRTAQLAKEFEARNTKPLGLSTDTVEEHNKWISDVNETQNTDLQFPIVADADKKISELYEMIHPGESSTAAVRSVYIIDPNKKIRLMMTYPMQVGRNFDEILRVIDSLQLGDANGVVTGADWQKGDKVIIPPTLSNEEAQQKFPQGFEELKSYLRLTEIK
ncbi:peroxiredoxin (alkyl hydroperoxide reductase subunit C) [Thiohalospira halophila DSM 15071]|uniref:Thioredoxin peroxidase n=1 Tax=Thiohalospira halophila DSM 15071 TaxID=1123397 RepID=A0A1I1VP63_9GAMM|nr:peroxiredoxin [Thiohalospira halophila]SFD84816.1 peroxiredoxin (alkyl hydroperoxide reductase subunit C) [Thiohalospira halophila DSM 15071]